MKNSGLFNVKSFILITITFSLVCTLGQTSCRKKVEREDFVYSDKPIHCFNGVKDKDETMVDLGGSCGCGDKGIQVNCGISKNIIKVGAQDFSVDSFTLDTINQQIDLILYFDAGSYIKTSFDKYILFNKSSYHLWRTASSDNEWATMIYYQRTAGSDGFVDGDPLYMYGDGCEFSMVICDGRVSVGGNNYRIKMNLDISKIFVP